MNRRDATIEASGALLLAPVGFRRCRRIGRRAATAFLAAAMLVTWSAARADDYPSRTIRFIVPYAAGTTVDIRARQVADRIGGSLGRSVIVENRPGAGAPIGAAHVARSAADGYTILVGSIADQAVAPNVYPNLTYNPRKDFAAITQYAETAPILVAPPGLGVSSVQELIALAKRKPGEVFVGSWGNDADAPAHAAARAARQHPDQACAVSKFQPGFDRCGRRTDIGDLGLPGIEHALHRGRPAQGVDGRRRQTRGPAARCAERGGSGTAGDAHLAWGGFFAPAGTPEHIVARLNREIVRALNAPEMKALFAEQGSRVVTNSPEEFAAFVRSEQDALTALARAAGARAD